MNSTMPILAIFDLDNTLLRGDSDYEMVNYLIDKNFVDKKYRQINEDYFNDYGDGNLNINEFSKFSLKPFIGMTRACLLYTSPSPRDGLLSRMPSSA